jgi:hypothetical protein
MERLPEHWTWTKADEQITYRAAFGWDHGELDLIPPCRFIEELPVVKAARLPRRSKRREGPPFNPEPDDEEPSQVTWYVVQRQRSRPNLLQTLVLGGLLVGVVTVGVIAVRSLMGAS